MVRIGELTFESNVNYGQKEISIIVPLSTTDSDILVLKAADLLEVLDSDNKVVGSYRLIDWKKEERLWNGILFTWQTISVDEVDALKEQVNTLQATLGTTNADLADLTATVQDLADAIERGDLAEAKAILDILLGEETPDEPAPEVGEGE